MNQEKKIFIAYSKEDRSLLDELVSHLSVLERSGKADVWHDGEIEAGADWENSKKEALQNADIILLLISADFINSDYCYEVEMQSALKRHEQGTAKVIPVLMRDCAWQLTPFAKLQVLPTNHQPIANDRLQVSDDALSDVVEEIYEVMHPSSTVFDPKKPERKVIEKRVVVEQPSKGNNKLLLGGLIGVLLFGLIYFGAKQFNKSDNPTTDPKGTPLEIPKETPQNPTQNQPTTPTKTSTDGFETLKFGNQIWMAENLKIRSNKRGDICYDNLDENCQRYGTLVSRYFQKNPCPPGWKLPRLEDWKKLLSAQGESFSTNAKGKIGYRFLTSSTFNAPLAGMLRAQPKTFKDKGEKGYLWTNSIAAGDDIYILVLDGKEQTVKIEREYLGRRNAFSCRCIKE